METEQEITVSLLSAIASALQMRDEVPPRLIVRALGWSMRRIMELEQRVENVRDALESKIVID